MLHLVWFRILGLFGLMLDSFWDHFGFLGPGSIFGNQVFSGIPYWELWDSVLEAWGRPNGRFEGPGLTLSSILDEF